MIEIKEIRDIQDMNEKKLLGIFDDSERTFIFIDRNKTLGVIQFSVRHPQLAELLALKINNFNSLADNLIVDGLVRTACHTFQRENITWIVAEKEKVDSHLSLPAYFTPMERMRDTIPNELLNNILKHQHNVCLMKTDMIYKGCCKGD